jgi:outer membrane protein
MRRLFRQFGLTLAGLSLVVPGALAQTEAKIGYVNSEQLFEEYSGFQSAQTAYQAELEQWMQQLREREQSLNDLQSSYQAQQPMLSDERRLERETEIQRKLQDYEQFRQSIFGQGGRADMRNQELLEPVLAEVQSAVEKIAEEEGFDLIFDAVDGNIIYGNDDYDITERVLDELGGTDGVPDDPVDPEEPETP